MKIIYGYFTKKLKLQYTLHYTFRNKLYHLNVYKVKSCLSKMQNGFDENIKKNLYENFNEFKKIALTKKIFLRQDNQISI